MGNQYYRKESIHCLERKIDFDPGLTWWNKINPKQTIKITETIPPTKSKLIVFQERDSFKPFEVSEEHIWPKFRSYQVNSRSHSYSQSPSSSLDTRVFTTVFFRNILCTQTRTYPLKWWHSSNCSCLALPEHSWRHLLLLLFCSKATEHSNECPMTLKWLILWVNQVSINI